MTNEKDGATAPQGQPKGDDNGVAASVAAAQAAPEPTLDERIKEALGTQLDQYGQQVKQTIDQAQGRAQQFYGDKLKEDRSELATFMGDLTQVLDDDQKETLDTLREQRRIESVDKRLKAFEEGTLTPQTPQQQAAAPQMSEQDANALYESVDALIEASGLDIKPSDEGVWTGFKSDMPLQQAVNVARKNIKKMRSASAPAPAATPAAQVPPTTSGADSIPAAQYDSLSDLAAAFRDREINSVQYSSLARENGWMR
tara:strand:+ start:828 stop:1595 length:768 start_codon:yes stop_codon:yes gene_type:complete